jgi:hypothetical protein
MSEGPQKAHEARVGAREIVLFLHALRLSVKAQGVRRQPLLDVVSTLVSTRSLPRGVGAGEAARAAGRACSRVKRWGRGLDSCLTRSLVAGALLSDQPRVVLHVGFRGARTETLHEGHAWVTLGDRNVTAATDSEHEGPFTEALQLAISRPEGS